MYLHRNIPASGGALATLTGANFGAVDLTPSSLLSLMLCLTRSWSSYSTVQCIAGTESTQGDSAQLVTSSIAGMLLRAISFDAPALSDSYSNPPQSGGASLTLAGVNFGFADVSPTAAIGTTACATSTYVSMTTIKCLTSSSTELDALSILTVSATVGTAERLFTMDAPVLSQVMRLLV